jgi:hypothetical protein
MILSSEIVPVVFPDWEVCKAHDDCSVKWNRVMLDLISIKASSKPSDLIALRLIVLKQYTSKRHTRIDSVGEYADEVNRRLNLKSHSSVKFGRSMSRDSLTVRLLLARPNSYLSDFNRLETIGPSTSDPTYFLVRFRGRLIHGLTLVFLSEVPGSYKIFC